MQDIYETGHKWPLSRRVTYYGAAVGMLINMASAVAFAGQVYWPVMIMAAPIGLVPFVPLALWSKSLVERRIRFGAAAHVVVSSLAVLALTSNTQGAEGDGAQQFSIFTFPLLVTVLVGFAIAVSEVIIGRTGRAATEERSGVK